MIRPLYIALIILIIFSIIHIIQATQQNAPQLVINHCYDAFFTFVLFLMTFIEMDRISTKLNGDTCP